MCLKGGWFVTVSLLISLIQSAVWMSLNVISALVYLCVISVPPYKSSIDFLLVTSVKLYFEGPECIPDGSYLGQFNKDYRNPQVLRLFTPDKMFGVMVAYFVINAAYFILSIKCWLNRKPKSTAAAAQWQNDLFMAWGVITLIICAIDLILSAKLICDVISLKDYMNDMAEFLGDKNEKAEVIISAAKGKAEIPYIPLMLALISSRLIGIWLWNLVVGLIFFFNSLCCRSLTEGPPEIGKEQEKRGPYAEEVIQPPTREHPTSKNQRSGTYISAYDIQSHPDFAKLKKSSEAVTRFSSVAPKTVYPNDSNRSWTYVPPESTWQLKPNTSKDSWEMTNEGYVSDDQVEPERSPDFDHDLKNFEQGQGKIKIVRPPIGKPVSIPVPPPLPTSGSCNC